MTASAPALRAIELLAERFPGCFAVDEGGRRPLKIGIRQDLVAFGILSKTGLKAALHAYCSTAAYRSLLVAGATRIDLDGNPAGVVTPEQVRPPKSKKRPQAAKPASNVKAPKPESPAAATLKRLSFADLRRAAEARKGGAA
jgi:ProP effector